MLQTLDVLIGVTVVMLMISVVVTAWTQMVVYFLNSRGKYLSGGLADILGQVAPNLDKEEAKKVAAKILTHPLICNNPKRFGEVIQREELTKLVLELASGDGPQDLEDTIREKLIEALAAGGIQDSKQVLDNVRSLLIHLELSNPEMSNAGRASVAFLKEANSRFLGKLNTWFDPVMDRVTDRFTVHARQITVVGAFAVALLLQLDTIALVNKLSVDPNLRRSLVERAYQINNQPAPGVAALPSANRPGLTPEQQTQVNELTQLGIIVLPSPKDWHPSEWINGIVSGRLLPRIFGMLLSGVLLSFGAPFWYNALRSLLKLRSVLANKDDAQRNERQTTQTPAAATVAVAPKTATVTASAGPATLVGERGILG